jgi:predicted metal-dependent hydrolase
MDITWTELICNPPPLLLCHLSIDLLHSLVKMLFTIPEKYSITCPGNYAALAVTCSLEHFTAILAELLLTTPQGKTILNAMSQSHRTIWIWHAIEEIEHKSVTYDVFQAVQGSYLCRVYWHFLTTFLFILALVVLNVQFAFSTGDYFDVVGLFKLLHFLFVTPGFLRLLVPLWAEYLRPNYHPWGTAFDQRGIDDRNKTILESVAKWQNEMELLTGKKRAAVSSGAMDEAKVN